MENIISIANKTIKPAIGNRKVYNTDGDTSDIIKAILTANKTCAVDTKMFAKHLVGNTTEETIRNVWGFVKNNIRYVLDPIGEQYVKTPARTWSDGYADCKSRSIFQASILQNLGIPFAYRFASYDPKGTYTHVYVVAKPKGNKYVSDPDMPEFNTEKKAAATLDKDIIMSRIEMLSGPGDNLDFQHHKAIGNMTEFDYDLAIQKHSDKIDKALIEKMSGIGALKAERYQDRIDMIDSMIDISKDPALSGDEKLRGIGVICEMIEKGHFDTSNSISGINDCHERERQRTHAYKHRVHHAKTLAKSGYKPYVGKVHLKNILKKAAGSFKSFNKKILNFSKKLALTPLQLPFKASLEVLLPKAAPFFLYLFITNQKTIDALPDNVRRKRLKQQKIAKLIVGAVGMKEAHFMGLLRNGIKKHYGKSPETVLAAMVKGPISGIGIIDDIIKVVFSVIKQIAKLFKKKDADASSATKDDAPSPDDFGTASAAAKQAVMSEATEKMQSQSSGSDDTSTSSKSTGSSSDTDSAKAVDESTSTTDSGEIPTVNRKKTSIC